MIQNEAVTSFVSAKPNIKPDIRYIQYMGPVHCVSVCLLPYGITLCKGR